MAREIPAGTSHELRVTIAPDMSPPHLKDVQVLSTPSMINLMEQCALQAMVPYLDDEETSVGTEVCVTHDAALRVGEVVVVRARLREMQGRRYVWEVQAVAEDGKSVGAGTHTRAAVKLARLRG